MYLIGVELQSNASEQLAFAIPLTGGKYYNVRRTTDVGRWERGRRFSGVAKVRLRDRPAVPLLELDAGE